MTAPVLAMEGVRETVAAAVPAPYNGPTTEPDAPAALLAWLTSAENTFTTGQIIFVDGGTEAIARPDRF